MKLKHSKIINHPHNYPMAELLDFTLHALKTRLKITQLEKVCLIKENESKLNQVQLF